MEQEICHDEKLINYYLAALKLSLDISVNKVCESIAKAFSFPEENYTFKEVC